MKDHSLGLRPHWFVCLALVSMVLSPSCSAPQQCESPCGQAGERKCGPQGQNVVFCGKNEAAGCLQWFALPCGAGRACVVSAGQAACSTTTPPGGCQSPCSEGQKRCAGNQVESCLKDAKGCLAWGSGAACPAGQVCQNGQCQTSCQQVCQAGAARCDGDKLQRCEVDAASQCPLWGAPQDCPAGQSCQPSTAGASCQQAGCDTCLEGKIQCDSQGQFQLCSKDAQGCLVWGAAQACPAGQSCQNGRCTDGSCNDACTDGQTRCDGTRLQSCIKDAKGCLLWGTPSDCPAGQSCQGGACAGACNNACAAGQARCANGKLQSCTKDAQGCLGWGAPQACPAGQSCDKGACQKPGCNNACTAGQKRCANGKLQSCVKDAQGCLIWNAGAACPAGQSCQTNKCVASCNNACTAGQKRCATGKLQSCVKDAKGCLIWNAGAACPAGQICDAGKCTTPTNPGQRTVKMVCDRWKKDYPATKAVAWTGSGCTPGKISQGSIDDAIRRFNLYRWLVGLDPVTANNSASLLSALQQCAVMQANNRGVNSNDNPHRPPTTWKCYTAQGAQAARTSNLAHGYSTTPAYAIQQLLIDAGCQYGSSGCATRRDSLGHRLPNFYYRMGKTAFGYAEGTGPFRRSVCQPPFDGSNSSATRPDFTAFPAPGPFPVAAFKHPSGRNYHISWSFTSSKYRVTNTTKVTLIRKSDKDTQTPFAYRISWQNSDPGIAFRPRPPKAGETYTVKIGTLFSYEVQFVNCP